MHLFFCHSKKGRKLQMIARGVACICIMVLGSFLQIMQINAETQSAARVAAAEAWPRVEAHQSGPNGAHTYMKRRIRAD